ncbi:hypothetical protein GM612_12180, partial [Lactobacillus sp. CRM56-3]|nr:hypothetical protein [Secundilactobacillus folii]
MPVLSATDTSIVVSGYTDTVTSKAYTSDDFNTAIASATPSDTGYTGAVTQTV